MLNQYLFTLFYAEVSVDRGISSCSCQILSLTIGDVFAVSLNVSFGEAEVNEEYFMGGFVESDAEVVRFDVSVNKMSIVDVLDS
jgi:hypothetical protein